MLKKTMGLILVSALLSVPAFSAANDNSMREMQDRTEINDLMWNYVRALDTLNEDAYAAVYTEDGQFGTGPNASKGREALKKIVADVRKGRTEREAKGEPKSPPMYHVVANSMIKFADRDHAQVHAYWMTMFAAAGAETPARVAAAGRSIDEVVRVKGKWLIKSRNVAPQD
jgi:3-phenylpropionate/cinnamic acid dioxygenase small subunit